MLGYVVAVVVGVSSGLAGVIYTNWRAERLERRRWAREDALRTYEHRRQAYIGFLAEYQKHEEALDRWDMQHGGTGNFPDPPEDWLLSLFKCLTDIEIFGSKLAYQAALRAYLALDEYGTTSKATYDDMQEAKVKYVTQIRSDLGVRDE